MDISTAYLETAENRLALYSFFARIYRTEIDQQTLGSLRNLKWDPSEGNKDFAHGASLLGDFLAHPSLNERQDLAVDYAKTFLAAGIPQGDAAFPYESVYTSEDGLVMQDARDAVVRSYRSKGLAVEGFVEPEDHIAFELEFMAHLCREGTENARTGNSDKTRENVVEQRSFLQEHLLNWVPQFCSDVDRYANTTFYRAIAFLTKGFLSMDAQELERLLTDKA